MQYSEYFDSLELSNLRKQLNRLNKLKVNDLTNFFSDIFKQAGGKYNVTSSVKVMATITPNDLIDAAKDLEDPALYAKVMEKVNQELCPSGDIYNISTEKSRMLGLTNRYIENAQLAKYARKWTQFAFYMRAVAYYVPQLLLQANIKDANFILTASSKKKRDEKWFKSLPKEFQDFMMNNKEKILSVIGNSTLEESRVDLGNRKTLSKKN